MKRVFIVSALLSLNSCKFLEMALNPNYKESTGNVVRKNVSIPHDGSEPSALSNLYSGASPAAPQSNVLKQQRSASDSQIVSVRLPADRCKAGTMTFGLLNGQQVTCSVLGRGVTRYWEQPPARYRIPGCLSSRDYVDTVASDWQKGSTCWFLKEHKRCGATPTRSYRLSYNRRSGAPSKWGSVQPVAMSPIGGAYGRGGLLTHSDSRFGYAPNIEAQTHSTAGCLKLEPACQKLFVQFNRENSGLKMVVQNI